MPCDKWCIDGNPYSHIHHLEEEPLNPDGDEPEDPPEQGPYPLDDPGDDEKRSAHGK